MPEARVERAAECVAGEVEGDNGEDDDEAGWIDRPDKNTAEIQGRAAGGSTTRRRNILERITFYDIDSQRIEKHLTEEERILYLKEIKADISYFKRSYERADLQVAITGLDPEASAAAIDARLGRT
jgi:hypothetical protein